MNKGRKSIKGTRERHQAYVSFCVKSDRVKIEERRGRDKQKQIETNKVPAYSFVCNSNPTPKQEPCQGCDSRIRRGVASERL